MKKHTRPFLLLGLLGCVSLVVVVIQKNKKLSETIQNLNQVLPANVHRFSQQRGKVNTKKCGSEMGLGKNSKFLKDHHLMILIGFPNEDGFGVNCLGSCCENTQKFLLEEKGTFSEYQGDLTKTEDTDMNVAWSGDELALSLLTLKDQTKKTNPEDIERSLRIFFVGPDVKSFFSEIHWFGAQKIPREDKEFPCKTLLKRKNKITELFLWTEKLSNRSYYFMEQGLPEFIAPCPNDSYLNSIGFISENEDCFEWYSSKSDCHYLNLEPGNFGSTTPRYFLGLLQLGNQEKWLLYKIVGQEWGGLALIPNPEKGERFNIEETTYYSN